jgi:hypothetical protein
MRKILSQTENITEIRIEIDSFGKMDRSVNPTKLKDNEFYTKENLINKVGNYGSIERRNGLSRFNSNALSAKPIMNLFEARQTAGYTMLGKDNTGAGSSILRYLPSPYTGTWTNVVTNEYAGFYHFAQFKDLVYISNRLDASQNLLGNEVWTGTTNIFEHGCPVLNTDSFTGASNATAGGLEAIKYYFYIVTFLYEGYQESGTLNYVRVQSSATTLKSILLSNLGYGGTRVKAKNIYRSTGMTVAETSIPQYMYYLTTITDTTTATFLDVKADSALSGAIPIENFFNQKRPYRSKFTAVANNRLIQANLEIESTRYSALSASDITLGVNVGGGTLGTGTYKYRFYKCFISPSGGRFGFIVGNYVEKTAGATTSPASITISIANLATTMDSWCNYVLIQRTVVGGSEFHYVGVADKDDLAVGSATPYIDGYSDASLLALSATSPIDIIYAGETVNASKIKGALVISDIGAGDLISAENLKLIDAKDDVGISGIFSEPERMVIFSGNGIYGMRTTALDSTFWTIEKLIDHIGVSYQEVSNTKTETSGHKGILQLPDGGGYIFFNRPNSTSATTPVNIYFWDGKSQPIIISNEIYNYINGFSSIIVKGMCYDFARRWVWVNMTTSTQSQILIYDLEFKEWYVCPLDAKVLIYDLICTEDGRIITGNNTGELLSYDLTVYQDWGSGADNAIVATLITKDIDEHDADINVTQVQVACDTSTAGLDLTQILSITDQAGSTSTQDKSYMTLTGLIHRTKQKVNSLCRRFRLSLSNDENKNIIINKIDIDCKILNAKEGGQ